MDEFQEADVLWPDAHHHHDCHRHHHHHQTDQQQQHNAARPVRLQLSSAPMRIPEMAEARPRTSRPLWARSHDHHYYDDDEGGVRRASSAEAAMIVPPHVLAAARRCAEERRVASSVCVGHGRTLKGRDLRAVRNAVLHMTGFLSSSDKY
ncbi:hypothetical protein ACP70R_036794 [Stipagrostis hirtigluma subsp. patula]